MSTTKNIQSTIKLAISILICQTFVAFSVLLTISDSNYWYEALIMPTWKLSIYFFGSIWSFLYFLVAVSVWIIWISGRHKAMKK